MSKIKLEVKVIVGRNVKTVFGAYLCEKMYKFR